MSRSYKKNSYQESRKIDVTCRNHGKCSYCADGRQHRHLRAPQQLEDVEMKDCAHPLCKDGYWPDGDACAACDGWGYT